MRTPRSSWRRSSPVTPYRILGAIIGSAIPLPEVEAAPGEIPQIRFEELPAGALAALPAQMTPIRSEPAGAPFLHVLRLASGYLLRFADMADFEVSSEGDRIRCRPVPALPPETMRHLLLDQVIPRALSLRGRLVLHASAVAVEGVAIAFLGPTGQGKSSLATSFARAGFPLLADDTVVLQPLEGGAVAAVPSYPGVRLWAEDVAALLGEGAPAAPVAHYTSKLRVGRGLGFRFARDPLPLGRLYVLDPVEVPDTCTQPVIERPTLPQALVLLLPQVFRMDVTGRSHLRSEFEMLASSPALALVRVLRFQWGLERLSDIRGAVLADVSANP